MSRLHHRTYVACPYKRAKSWLADTLGGLADSGNSSVIALHVPLRSDGGVAMDKNVVVTYSAGADPQHFDEPWNIKWTPENGGPYPDFEGTLTVHADEDYTGSWIELAGTYQPPLGVAGKLFDAVLGSSIADATATEFLRRLGTQIEERYRREEAEKPTIGRRS